jgi:hypothetical protein
MVPTVTPTAVGPGPSQSVVPTLSPAMLALLVAALAGAGLLVVKRIS